LTNLNIIRHDEYFVIYKVAFIHRIEPPPFFQHKQCKKNWYICK